MYGLKSLRENQALQRQPRKGRPAYSPRTESWVVFRERYLVPEGRLNPCSPVSAVPPPDFLWNLVALANFMRLSLLKGARAGLVQRCVAGNPGPGLASLLLRSVPRTSVLGYIQVAPTGLELQIRVLTQTL